MNYELPLISIALCTYNGAKYLSEQLDSLLNQTYPNLELVIQDDCSTDTTWDILKQYEAHHPHIKLFRNNSNLGFQKNFESILGKCIGDWIAISDQDDIWLPEKIETLYRLSKGNILVYHDSELVDENGTSLNKNVSDKFNFISGKNPNAFLFFNCVSGHSMMFSNKLINLIFPFPTNGYYDHWIAFVGSHCGSIAFSERQLVKYRQHQSNVTDMFGLKTKVYKLTHAKNRMWRENRWLESCATFEKLNGISGKAHKLYKKGKNRNSNYLNIEFALSIWKDRQSLLPIIHKSDTGKFFFALRHIWGMKSKSLFKI